GSGDSDPAHNIPGRPLLAPILVVWGALGLGYALRRPLEPLHAGALIWLAGFLVTAIAIAPGNHEQMLALTPALFFFPVLGMAVTVRAALERGTRTATVVITVVALSIIGSAVWSVYDYVQWTGDGETYQAFQGDVRDALEEVAVLPNDGHMVYFSTGKHGRIVRYLASERSRRDFDNTSTLPLPAEGSAYLVVPASAALHESLALYLTEESLAATGKDPDGENAYRVWFVDVRTRERLPYAVPTIFFEHGPVLVGFEVSPLDTGTSQP